MTNNYEAIGFEDSTWVKILKNGEFFLLCADPETITRIVREDIRG